MRDIMRTRWAAIGAAVAITLGAGGVSLTQAALTSGEKPVYVALTEPCRLVDTRPASQIGPKGTPIADGDAETYEIQVTGNNGNCTGALAVPADAAAVALNVTAIAPVATATGRSYFTVYPGDASRPTTSNLNFLNGAPPTPNKVDVGLSAGGAIKIYNFEGTAHAAVDIFGYYIDHGHTGDDIVDSSLTHVDIRDEPGVVTGFNATPTALSGTVTRAASTSIRVPADGYLVVEASGIFVSSGAGEDEAWCQITKGGVPASLSILSNTQPWVALNDHGDGGTELTGFSTHRVFEVDVADNPLFVQAGQAVGLDCLEMTGTTSTDDVIITATYYPRSYAPISIIAIP